ncbi:MAG: glycoside hydrolase family 140 protein [Bacteroidales bacterium]|nr:glycoside hydrolase family 140 protein [Bacteroidales bacterium]
MKNLIILIVFSSIFIHTTSAKCLPRLQVSRDGHHLVDEQGKAFFYLADTGWELFHKLNREQALQYLKDRKQKGFNVIQAVMLSENDGINSPNAYGDLPLTLDNLPLNTEGSNTEDEHAYDYWDHVDYIIQKAAELEVYMGALPCWGEYVVPREGNAIFNKIEEAYQFGYYVGNRYKKFTNIIWILGGDRHPDERKEGIDLWRAMAEGIADGTNGTYLQDGIADYTTTLMTHHASVSSSKWFHNDAWIDFHMWGSYHALINNIESIEKATFDWNLPNPKPTINGEPAYEKHPLNWMPENGCFSPYDVRQAAYWSVFSGACGYTYGCHPVWQFYREGDKPISNVQQFWYQALNAPGATQVTFLKKLIDSRPFLQIKPDQDLLAEKSNDFISYVRATSGENYAFVYIPFGYPVKVNFGKISGKMIRAWWYNPRDGQARLIGEYKNTGSSVFDPPGLSEELSWLKTGSGCDWVLVLDDVAANYSQPGKIIE